MSIPSSASWSRPELSPAYTAVPARTTLARPVPNPPQATETMPVVIEWTQDIKDYVARAFEPKHFVDGISKAELTEKLKDTISYFAQRNIHREIDWLRYPLPQDIIREERRYHYGRSGIYAPPRPTIASNGQTNPAPTPSKKRKSQNGDDYPFQPQANGGLQDRITYEPGRNDKKHKRNGLSGDAPSKFDDADVEKRKQRFQRDKRDNAGLSGASPRRDGESDMTAGPVIGTNMSLEKRYFRLTAPPKADTVRPLQVLEKTLGMLTEKWKLEKNYNYVCNQFKSLRQDLTVQHIKNNFTVKVYEIHARIALEKGDLGEYNQCQTQLKGLYTQKLGGHPAEFTAYRILYFVYTCNKSDMNDLLAELTPTDKSHQAIKHALDVRSSLALGNYHKFFRLYLNAYNMGSYLMDRFIERERLSAVANMARGYHHVTLRFLTDELGFESDAACREFLKLQEADHVIEEITDKDDRTYERVKLKEAAALFERRRASAFSSIDIKGQI